MKYTASFLFVLLGWACATTPEATTPQAIPIPTASAPTPLSSSQVNPPEPAASQESAATTPKKAEVAPSKPEPSGPAACPAGMLLVEGEYCSKVKQVCKRHWYDKSNKKKVCEEFVPKTECIGKRTKKRFCIDKYSWPNKEGVRPEVMNNFYQAQIKCAALGKRMCTESEWTFACEGPEMKPFPYGYVRNARICNGDHKWDHPSMRKMAKRNAKEIGRLWRGVPSGSQPKCVSDFGVYDLPANNDEVVSGESRKAKYNSVHTGGPWYKGVRNQCRPKIYSHDEGFYYYFLGFRCCAEPDGQESDPRTPKQIREKVRFKNVERIAGFGVERTRQALELKRKGLCTCPAPTPEAAKVLPRNRVLCKTLCGTTVGENAKDGDDSTRMQPGAR